MTQDLYMTHTRMYSSIQLKPGANTGTRTENIIIIIITLCLQKGATIFLPLTWLTAEGFSKFFHPDLAIIYSKAKIKYLTTTQTHYYTTL